MLKLCQIRAIEVVAPTKENVSGTGLHRAISFSGTHKINVKKYLVTVANWICG